MARRSKAPRKKSNVVDGFTTMKAAQRAVGEGVTAPKPKAPAHASKPASDGLAAPRTRISQTAQPTKHEIVCYECGFGFTITGLLQNAYCPKCRVLLETGDHSIDREWSGSIRTIGTVTITEKGRVVGGRITTNNVILKGRIDDGKVEICGKLTLDGTGTFSQSAVEVQDLAIAKGANTVLARKLSFRNVDISGKFKAKVTASGVITVRSGAEVRGELTGSHLVVEDGGAISAKISVKA